MLILVSGLTLVIILFPNPLRPSTYPLSVGSVAPQDIQAPRALTYESRILTEQARFEAEMVAPPVYLPADPSITRRQIERMRLVLNYIHTVRSDSHASLDQKIQDLEAIQNLSLSREAYEQTLILPDSRWEATQQEALKVLEQVMRATIREDMLQDARRNVPTLISFTLPQEQAMLVAELVIQLVVPNSLRSEELTRHAIEEARSLVQPVTYSFAAGETIVQRGQVITHFIMEALEEYHLVKPGGDPQDMVAAAILVVLISAATGLYLSRRDLEYMRDAKNWALLSAFFLIFLYTARLVIPNRAIIPYVFPIPAFGLTFGSLFSAEIGLIFSLILSILSTYGMPDSVDLTLFYLLSSLCGILVLGKGKRVTNFIYAGVAIGAAGSAVVLAYRMPGASTDWFGIVTLVGAAFFNGMASASVSLLLQFISSQSLGLTTSLQLMEILRSDHPLLQFIMRNAPGTYQHGLQVGNLAEQAAEAIGADGLLVRAGAIYHDAGKALNPSFFIENQLPGQANPHDNLDPEVSAANIIRHVRDGVQLARKYRLPPRMQDFILEHHGTLIARYQYAKAAEKHNGDLAKVNIDAYRYPGPAPRSRETALLMLADGCEARARAEMPANEEELQLVVDKVIELCRREGQLDDTTLTLRDLKQVSKSFVSTLRNTHHPRLKYPELNTKPLKAEKSSA